MDTAEALSELGITHDDLSAENRRRLDEDGYFLVEDVFNSDQVEQLRREFDRWEEREAVTLPTYNIEPGGVFLIDLFNKSDVFDLVFLCKPTLEAAHELLGEVRISSLNGRNPAKNSGQQLLHSDGNRFGPTDWRVVNTMILLDDMSAENGATRLVPGSHKWPAINVPYEFALQETDPTLAKASDGAEISEDEKALIPEDPVAPHPLEVLVTGRAGTICVINAHIWHGGTQNSSGGKRRLLHFAVGRRDRQPELVQRDYLTPSLRSRTSAAQKYLLDIEGADAVAPDVE